MAPYRNSVDKHQTDSCACMAAFIRGVCLAKFWQSTSTPPSTKRAIAAPSPSSAAMCSRVSSVEFPASQLLSNLCGGKQLLRLCGQVTKYQTCRSVPFQCLISSPPLHFQHLNRFRFWKSAYIQRMTGREEEGGRTSGPRGGRGDGAREKVLS